MKIFISLLNVILFSLVTSTASARNDIAEYVIADALASEQAKAILGNDIKFYFGEQPHAKPVKSYSIFSTSRKTNGANKSDQQACTWAFLSTMKALKEKAQRLNANAVVNIRSNYKNNLTTSTTHFKCGSGMLMSGVALTGEVVSLPQ